MQLLATQQGFRDYFTELYYFNANQNNKFCQRDNKAALKIQSQFRKYIRRKEYLRKRQAAIVIQTFFRGCHAKTQFKQKKRQEDNRKNMLYFSKQAIIIQKVFKGYFVRNYVHNFYLRKEELKALERKNEQFKKSLEEFGRAQALEAQEYEKEQAKAQFKSLARNLHHLTSTRNIPGVYNSPFVEQKPAVFDKTVQDHLKQEFKSSYRWRAPKREDIQKFTIRPASQRLK